METGTYISGAGHVALLGWLMIGPVFNAEPLPMQVTEVAVISSEAFEALSTPQPDTDAPVEVALPAPAPPPVETPESAAEVQPEEAAVLPPEPAPRPADRIAPEPVPIPEPEAAPDPVQQEAVSESEPAEVPAEPQEATAPEETAPEIVTEAEEVPETAPLASLRPPARRPTRPVEQAEAAPAAETPEPAEPANDPLAAALAEALDDAPSSAPAGPLLTGGEKEGLRVAVSQCWNVGALSSEAQETRVTVAVEMRRDGKPVTASIRMIGHEGGSAASAKRVFDTARRAIIRCGAKGFPLPVEKYAQWREIEMTFNPEGMFY